MVYTLKVLVLVFLIINVCYNQDIEKMKLAADSTFEKILFIFQQSEVTKCDVNFTDPCNYWQLGNSFDTVTDYLRQNPSNSERFADAAIKTYNITSKKYNN